MGWCQNMISVDAIWASPQHDISLCYLSITSVYDRASHQCMAGHHSSIWQGITSVYDRASHQCMTGYHISVWLGITSVYDRAYYISVWQGITSVYDRASHQYMTGTMSVFDRGIMSVYDRESCHCITRKHISVCQSIMLLGHHVIVWCQSNLKTLYKEVGWLVGGDHVVSVGRFSPKLDLIFHFV